MINKLSIYYKTLLSPTVYFSTILPYFPAISHTKTMLVLTYKRFSIYEAFLWHRAFLHNACTHTTTEIHVKEAYLWFQTTREHQRIRWRRRPPCAPQGRSPWQRRWRGTPRKAGEQRRPAILVWESTQYAGGKWRISEGVHCRRLLSERGREWTAVLHGVMQHFVANEFLHSSLVYPLP